MVQKYRYYIYFLFLIVTYVTGMDNHHASASDHRGQKAHDDCNVCENDTSFGDFDPSGISQLLFFDASASESMPQISTRKHQDDFLGKRKRSFTEETDACHTSLPHTTNCNVYQSIHMSFLDMHGQTPQRCITYLINKGRGIHDRHGRYIPRLDNPSHWLYCPVCKKRVYRWDEHTRKGLHIRNNVNDLCSPYAACGKCGGLYRKIYEHIRSWCTSAGLVSSTEMTQMQNQDTHKPENDEATRMHLSMYYKYGKLNTYGEYVPHVIKSKKYYMYCPICDIFVRNWAGHVESETHIRANHGKCASYAECDICGEIGATHIIDHTRKHHYCRACNIHIPDMCVHIKTGHHKNNYQTYIGYLVSKGYGVYNVSHVYVPYANYNMRDIYCPLCDAYAKCWRSHAQCSHHVYKNEWKGKPAIASYAKCYLCGKETSSISHHTRNMHPDMYASTYTHSKDLL